jgi:hypothetical protein
MGEINLDNMMYDIQLPFKIDLIKVDANDTRTIITIKKDPQNPGHYKLIDGKGCPLAYSTIIDCVAEARMSDGVTYASSDTIIASPLPPPPKIEIKVDFRDPKKQLIRLKAESGDSWRYINAIDILFKDIVYEMQQTIELSLDKNHKFSPNRTLKIPPEFNLAGRTFDILFKIPDGREWFRLGGSKPTEFEKNIKGIFDWLILLKLSSEKDFEYVRYLAMVFFRNQKMILFVATLVLGLLIYNIILAIPLIGPIVNSLLKSVESTILVTIQSLSEYGKTLLIKLAMTFAPFQINV